MLFNSQKKEMQKKKDKLSLSFLNLLSLSFKKS